MHRNKIQNALHIVLHITIINHTRQVFMFNPLVHDLFLFFTEAFLIFFCTKLKKNIKHGRLVGQLHPLLKIRCYQELNFII